MIKRDYFVTQIHFRNTEKKTVPLETIG